LLEENISRLYLHCAAELSQEKNLAGDFGNPFFKPISINCTAQIHPRNFSRELQSEIIQQIYWNKTRRHTFLIWRTWELRSTLGCWGAAIGSTP